MYGPYLVAKPWHSLASLFTTLVKVPERDRRRVLRVAADAEEQRLSLSRVVKANAPTIDQYACSFNATSDARHRR